MVRRLKLKRAATSRNLKKIPGPEAKQTSPAQKNAPLSRREILRPSLKQTLATILTQQRQAEQVLHETEERFRFAFELAPNGMALVGLDGRFVQVNRFLCNLLGYSEKELQGKTFSDISHPAEVAASLQGLREMLAGKFPLFELKKRYLTKSGSMVLIQLRTSLVRDYQGRPLYCVSHMQDITERERLFQEVEEGRDRLQHLSRRLVEVQEAERRAIARELHDEIGQELTVLKLNLERSASSSGAVSQQSLIEAQRRTSQLLKMVRELSLDLRPTMLDDLGLLPALFWQFDRFMAASAVRVQFKHTGLEQRRFPAEIETAVFRIIQEALTNVARHAQTKRVTVRLWANDETLSLQIEDDGIGFPVEPALRAGHSSGLSGMRERAALLGGQFTIESVPGSGTNLTARLPLDKKTLGNPVA